MRTLWERGSILTSKLSLSRVPPFDLARLQSSREERSLERNAHAALEIVGFPERIEDVGTLNSFISLEMQSKRLGTASCTSHYGILYHPKGPDC